MRSFLAVAAMVVGQVTYAAAELPAPSELETATTCKLAWDTTGPGWGHVMLHNDAERLVESEGSEEQLLETA